MFVWFGFLLSLSCDLSLNPGPSQHLPDSDNKFEHFHLFHINVSSLLSKIDELRYIAGHTKPAILWSTESKLGSSVSDQ